jgi:hypothetical protein
MGANFKLNHRQQDVQKKISGLYIDTLKNYYKNWYDGYELTLNFGSKSKIYKFNKRKDSILILQENYSIRGPYLEVEEKYGQLKYIYDDKKLYDMGINKKIGYFFDPLFVYGKCGFMYEPHLIKNTIVFNKLTVNRNIADWYHYFEFNDKTTEYFYNEKYCVFHVFRLNLNMGIEIKIYSMKYRIEFERSYPLVNKKINNLNILKINNELKCGMSYNF